MGQVAIELVEGTAVVTVNAEECASIWREVEPRVDAVSGVVLDFKEVTYLNSMNIAAIISLRAKLEAAGKMLRLCDLSDNIASIFRVLKLERLFDLSLSREAAVKDI